MDLGRSISREFSIFQHVFRTEEIKENHRSHGNNHDEHLDASSPQKSRDYERDDDDESDLPIIEKLSLSLSSFELENDRGWLMADSREPEDTEDRSQIQIDGRNNDDGERTGSMSTKREAFCNPTEDGAPDVHEYFNVSGLKRANPIYESESEAEHHVEFNRDFVKRRRNIVTSKQSPTPLYWGARLSSE